jgi:hypothetical protein
MPTGWQSTDWRSVRITGHVRELLGEASFERGAVEVDGTAREYLLAVIPR